MDDELDKMRMVRCHKHVTVVDGIGRFGLERNGFADEGLDENLRTPTKAKGPTVESRFLLNVVIGERAAIVELLSGENQVLLVRRDALLVLDLGLHIVNGQFYLEGDHLSGQGLDENLHTSAKVNTEVKGRLLLDVVIRESSATFKLLASKDEALLVGPGRDTRDDDQL